MVDSFFTLVKRCAASCDRSESMSSAIGAKEASTASIVGSARARNSRPAAQTLVAKLIATGVVSAAA